MGALTVARRGRGHRASTSRTAGSAGSGRTSGDIETEYVVIACGIWSPRIARDGRRVDPADPGGPPDDQRRAGPAVRRHRRRDRVPDRARHGHQHVRAPARQRPRGRLIRPSGDPHGPGRHPLDRGVGAVAHRAAVHPGGLRPPDGAGARARARRSLGDEKVGVRYAINGLLSLTPDGNPIIGETPEVKGLWSVAAIWIKEAPGHREDRRRVDDPRRRPRSTRTARTSPASTTTTGPDSTSGPGRPRASTRPTGSSTRWSSGRPTGPSACSPVLRAPAGARRRLLRGRRLGAAVLVRVQRAAARRVRRPGHAPRGRVGIALVVARSSTPSTSRCATGSAWWTCPRSRSSTSPARARSATSSACASTRWTSPSGGTVYTPLLNEAGGIVADLTIMRLAHDRFRVVTGGGMGMRDKKWFVGPPAGRRLGPAPRRHERAGRRSGSGGRGRATSWPSVTDGRRQPRRLPVRDLAGPSTSTASGRSRRGSATSASSAGRSTSRWSRASGSGTRSGRPGSRTAWSRSGIGAYAVTARLEKGYRAHGAELELDFDLVEAGMARPKRQGRRLRRQGGLPRAAGDGAGRDPVHADRRRPDLVERGQALHARPGADPDAATAGRSWTRRAAART